MNLLIILHHTYSKKFGPKHCFYIRPVARNSSIRIVIVCSLNSVIDFTAKKKPTKSKHLQLYLPAQARVYVISLTRICILCRNIVQKYVHVFYAQTILVENNW